MAVAELTSLAIWTDPIGPVFGTFFLTKMFARCYSHKLVNAVSKFALITIVAESHCRKFFAKLRLILQRISFLKRTKIMLVVSFLAAVTFGGGV
jgi:hypothetical protein